MCVITSIVLVLSTCITSCVYTICIRLGRGPSPSRFPCLSPVLCCSATRFRDVSRWRRTFSAADSNCKCGVDCAPSVCLSPVMSVCLRLRMGLIYQQTSAPPFRLSASSSTGICGQTKSAIYMYVSAVSAAWTISCRLRCLAQRTTGLMARR